MAILLKESQGTASLPKSRTQSLSTVITDPQVETTSTPPMPMRLVPQLLGRLAIMVTVPKGRSAMCIQIKVICIRED